MRSEVWPAAAAQEHVDHGIDQAGVDGGETEIFPFLGLEHAEHRGQRGIEFM